MKASPPNVYSLRDPLRSLTLASPCGRQRRWVTNADEGRMCNVWHCWFSLPLCRCSRPCGLSSLQTQRKHAYWFE